MFPYLAFGKVQSGEIAGATSATQMPDITARMVMFVAPNSNTGDVYIGAAGVTKPDGTTDTTTGYELKASAQTPWIPISNLNLFRYICDAATDDLLYLVLE